MAALGWLLNLDFAAGGAPAVQMDGFGSTEGFGAPTLLSGAATVAMDGFATGEGFGAPTIAPRYLVVMDGFGTEEAFGAPDWIENRTIVMDGLASTAGIGAPAVTGGDITTGVRLVQVELVCVGLDTVELDEDGI